MRSTNRPGVPILLPVACLLALLLAPKLVSFYVDWLWFGSVGLGQVFATSLEAQVVWTLAGGLLGFVIAYASHLAMARATRGRVLTVAIDNSADFRLELPGRLDRIALVAPVLAALVAGALFGVNWRTFLFARWRHRPLSARSQSRP